jgi:hypothetical protein
VRIAVDPDDGSAGGRQDSLIDTVPAVIIGMSANQNASSADKFATRMISSRTNRQQLNTNKVWNRAAKHRKLKNLGWQSEPTSNLGRRQTGGKRTAGFSEKSSGISADSAKCYIYVGFNGDLPWTPKSQFPILLGTTYLPSGNY